MNSLQSPAPLDPSPQTPGPIPGSQPQQQQQQQLQLVYRLILADHAQAVIGSN